MFIFNDEVAENRRIAEEFRFNSYIGTPCKKCGNNQRYYPSGNCISCSCKRKQTPEQLKRRKENRENKKMMKSIMTGAWK